MSKLLLFCFLIPFTLFSQVDAGRYGFGAYFGYGQNFHIADFKRIPDCPSCSPGYKDGFGTGLNLGLVVDYQFDNFLIFTSKLLFMDLSSDLVSREPTWIISNGVIQQGEFEHILNSKIKVFGIQPELNFNLVSNLKLNIGILFSALVSKEYSQVEKISKPSDFGTFVDEFGIDTKSRERNKFSGSMQFANSVFIAPMLSLSYKMPLNKNNTLFLEPEGSYYIGITDFVNSDYVNKWSSNILSFGISLKYSPENIKDTIYKEIEIWKVDTVEVESSIVNDSMYVKGNEITAIKSESTGTIIHTTREISRVDTIYYKKARGLSADVNVFGLSRNGEEYSDPKIKIEEFRYNRHYPLLNYIFFDENSSDIPQRYKLLQPDEIGQFYIDSLYDESTLGIYHHILNILGKRLSLYPQANITLIGCNSGLGNEKNNLILSQNRAEQIRRYLVNVWKIDSIRIKLLSKNLPEKASLPLIEQDKAQENQRVEILSDDNRITDALFIENFYKITNPPSLRFKLISKSASELISWSMQLNQKGVENSFKEWSGLGVHPAYVELKTDDYINTLNYKVRTFDYQFFVNSKINEKFSTDIKHFPLEIVTVEDKKIQKSDDFVFEKFSLILFEFDKSDIEKNNLKIVNLIKSKIDENSIVEIKGYTDRTGDNFYNKILSEKRAESVKKSIGLSNAIKEGIGEEVLLYDNDLPEGRFYCRTVEITIKTKIK